MDYAFEDSVRTITRLDDLLIWLVVKNSDNETLQHAFLLAYRTMFSIDDVVECLARLTDSGSINAKCCRNFIFLWVNGYFNIDWKKKIILPRMLEFSKSIMDDIDYNLLKNMCIKDMGIRRNNQVHSIPNSKTEHRSPKNLMNILTPSRPRSASADGTKEWSSLSTQTLATQLTVMEQELFCDVQPGEFLKDCWQSTHRDALSPRLSSLVKRFNDVSYWVATQIVMCSTVKHQTMTIKKFIKVAYKLYKFHNYNSLMQILSGLHNASVSRLKAAWAAVPGNAMDKFKKIDDFMSADQNFQQYRESMNELYINNIPALPYLVLFMRDITFIEENADRTADGNVNFLKLLRMGRQLHWFVHFARSEYGFTMDFHIQKVLMDLKFLTDSELYTLSLACEPKHTGSLGPSSHLSHHSQAHRHISGHAVLMPRVSEISRGRGEGEASDDNNITTQQQTNNQKQQRERRPTSPSSFWRKSNCWGVKVAN